MKTPDSKHSRPTPLAPSVPSAPRKMPPARRFAVLVKNSDVRRCLRTAENGGPVQRLKIRLSTTVAAGDILKLYIEPPREVVEPSCTTPMCQNCKVQCVAETDELEVNIELMGARADTTGTATAGLEGIKLSTDQTAQPRGADLAAIPELHGLCVPAWCKCYRMSYSWRSRLFYLFDTGLACNWADCTSKQPHQLEF